jgi:hypothetical protein
VPGVASPEVAVGDTLTVEWPNNTRSPGKIVAVSGTNCTIEIKDKQIELRRSQKGDLTPVRSSLPCVPWIVV